ncbi:hypothetical protein ABVF61_19510 [Roseibium sp. HPY-6]|uniref:hypothetical protein n=1 Tax=Roseibium sp. HPY-6 TaxID=3229852 RepID=UPI00338F81F8
MTVLERVAEVQKRLPANKNVVIFSGPDGRVFNCFDAAISENDLAEYEFLEKDIVRIRELGIYPLVNEIPRNCNYKLFTNPNSPANYLFYLPYDSVEIHSEECTRTLESYLARLLKK